MKVLWFTNIPLPGLSRALARPPEVTGGWMTSLLDELRNVPGIEIGVGTMIHGEKKVSRFVSDGVTYFSLPRMRVGAEPLTREARAAFSQAVETFGPDVIHVHGTEEAYGLFAAREAAGCPSVVSIQGLIHVCARHVGGGLTLHDAIEGRTHGLLSWVRYQAQAHQWEKRGRIERRIIAQNRWFIGRTAWDAAHIQAVNPEAHYFHLDEPLRAPFFEKRRKPPHDRKHTIFCAAAHSPLKGFHVLLDALDILRREFPDIVVEVAGAPWDSARGHGYYGRFLKSLIERRKVSRHVVAHPRLDAEQMARVLARSRTFVIPSLIENSPNSLAEAMLVGVPCVASFVGGIPSMIRDGENALAFPAGDAACLAQCVRRIFSDESLGDRLAASARRTALERHNPETIVRRQLEIYREIANSRVSTVHAARNVTS